MAYGPFHAPIAHKGGHAPTHGTHPDVTQMRTGARCFCFRREGAGGGVSAIRCAVVCPYFPCGAVILDGVLRFMYNRRAENTDSRRLHLCVSLHDELGGAALSLVCFSPPPFALFGVLTFPSFLLLSVSPHALRAMSRERESPFVNARFAFGSQGFRGEVRNISRSGGG